MINYKNKILIMFIILFLVTGCVKNGQNINNKMDNNISKEETNLVKIVIDEEEYMLQLEDNETSRSFTNLLPIEFNMNELNGNEKYVYLDRSLPTNSYNPKHINSGDVMLYGNNCLVIFYKSFDTQYSYSKIGHIENLPNLGNENVNVKLYIDN